MMKVYFLWAQCKNVYQTIKKEIRTAGNISELYLQKKHES